MKQALYREFAKYYDIIYSRKKYDKEVSFITAAAKKFSIKENNLLDVACGSGEHAKRLIKKNFKVTGVDLNSHILNIARKKVPKVSFKQGDMRTFSLKKKFDVITCLFTAINYNATHADLAKTLRNFKKHLAKGGILILDFPLPSRKDWLFSMDVTKNVRVIYDKEEKKDSPIIMYWMVKKGKNIQTEKDIHPVRFFSIQEMKNAVKKSGLKCKVHWDWSFTKKKGKRPVLVCYR